MVQINFAQKEIQCKIVYYGPGMSGKTTNLELVHGKVPDDHRGELTSIATTGERTLYFDYMPLDLGQIAGIRTKFQLYTVPGQIYYKSTRRLVLQGVDGIVFVADSSAAKLRENHESLQDLEENLHEMGKSIQDIPIVIQYNKRDLPDAMSVEDLQKELNPHGFPHTEAVATSGEGIFPTLKTLAGMVLESVNAGGLTPPRPKVKAKPQEESPEPVAVGSVSQATPAAAAASTAASAASTRGLKIQRPSGGAPAATNAPAKPAKPIGASSSRGVKTLGSVGRPMPSASGGGSVVSSVPAAGVAASRQLEDRVIRVDGLRRARGGSNKVAMIAGLALLIAGVAYFIASQL